MALTQETPATPAPGADPAGCPVDHQSLAYKKSVRPARAEVAPVTQDAQGVWQVRGFEEARAVLRSGATRQAGFNAEMVVASSAPTGVPILYQEGKAHQEQRTKTARFFTPKTVSAAYRQLMESLSDQLVAQIQTERQVDLSQISMTLAVQVAAQVIGLTNSRVAGLVGHLEAFFEQTGGAAPQTFLARLRQIVNLRRLLAFYWLDVRPAIAARRRAPQDDVISYLLTQQYGDRAILTECVTYAAAGMATTREFICMAAWHFLEHPALRARYLVAPEEARVAMLHEVLRLEPVIGHLYRRTTAELTLTSAGTPLTIPEGALIDLDIEAANVDEQVVGADPQAVCPGRPLHGERLGPMLLSFGDGAHRCPGAYLAIQETDIFLQRLLALDGLRITQPPTLKWNELTAGYELRRFGLALDPA